MEYEIYKNDDGSAGVFVVHQGQHYQADENHPTFNRIVLGLLGDDPEAALALFDIEEQVATRLESLSERVAVAKGRVYFDGVESDTSISRQILRLMGEYDDDVAAKDVTDFMPIVNFYENIMTNPTEHSREQLYDWLQKRGDWTITLEGNFIAYKGVDTDFLSHSSGHAFVDGEEVNDYVRNQVGSIITMPRDEVQHDPAVACAAGLHVATHDFAHSFAGGGYVLAVEINPRDVVSVPTECSAEKMRVCRYTVKEVIAEPVERALYEVVPVTPSDFDDEDEEGTGCDHCGCECDECDCVYGMECSECGCGEGAEDLVPASRAHARALSAAFDGEPVSDEELASAEEAYEASVAENLAELRGTPPDAALNSQSPLDQEPTFKKLMTVLTGTYSYTTAEVLHWLRIACGVTTTKDSLRRFKQRHGL